MSGTVVPTFLPFFISLLITHLNHHLFLFSSRPLIDKGLKSRQREKMSTKMIKAAANDMMQKFIDYNEAFVLMGEKNDKLEGLLVFC